MTNLDASAIREVERLTHDAEPIVTAAAEGQGVYFTRAPDGSLVKHRAPLDFQDVQVYDLDSLTRAASEAVEDGNAHTLYVHDNGVTLVQETDVERWTATLPLPTHPAFKLLSDWQQTTPMTQRELVRVLRTQLSYYVDATVIPTFSSLRMTSSSDGTSSITPSSQGLDRRIVKKVEAEQGRDVPEYIVFTPPVYDIPEDRDEEYAVKVYVEFDHDKERFLLLSVHDDLRKAREKAVAKIIASLRGTFDGALTVLYGQPK
ncbi:hypothetical protein ACI3L1_06595 [Deinococcus sp. SM5_A1]|uniref:hypothetical protein n=1 Tax=Deinococcus sp. SM5_A1 TaxID=3379094 RepID=UPI00385AB36C